MCCTDHHSPCASSQHFAEEESRNNFTMADVEEPVEETPVEEPEVEEEAEEDDFVAVGATEVKLFGKWSFDDIEIRDISLEVRIKSCSIAR